MLDLELSEKNRLHNLSLLTNTDVTGAFVNSSKYKIFSAVVMNTQSISYAYTVGNTFQLYSYAGGAFIGRVGAPDKPNVDASAFGGLVWHGTMYAGTEIKGIGGRA